MKIGIFDSGLGGLSVLYQAKQMLPQSHFLYYADEKHVPYGEKTPEQIRQYVEEIIAFFLEHKVDAIVIACNTATTVATKEFRDRFPIPIVGMEPAVKKAEEIYEASLGRILVTATPVTIRGNKLQALLERVDPQHKVDLAALPKLVRFAEREEFDSDAVDAYLQQEFCHLDLDVYDAVVLGCTHFNYFKQAFRRVFGRDIAFVDGNKGAIRQLMRVLFAQTGEDEFLEHKAMECEVCEADTEYFFSGERVDEQVKVRLERYLLRLQEMYRL